MNKKRKQVLTQSLTCAVTSCRQEHSACDRPQLSIASQPDDWLQSERGVADPLEQRPERRLDTERVMGRGAEQSGDTQRIERTPTEHAAPARYTAHACNHRQRR